MKTRQEKANEIRDLITQINARVAELEEDGYSVELVGRFYRAAIPVIHGLINDIRITRISKL